MIRQKDGGQVGQIPFAFEVERRSRLKHYLSGDNFALKIKTYDWTNCFAL